MGDPVKKKVVFFGSTKSGKSAVIEKATKGTFTENALPTIGVDFSSKNGVSKKDLELQIWDCPGDERFQIAVSASYHDAKVGVCVFDVAQRDTFNSVDTHVAEFREKNTDKTIPIILVGNKTDLEGQRVVTEAEAQEKAEALGLTYCECSAKTGFGVDALFTEIECAAVQNQPDSSIKAVRQDNSYAGVSFFRVCKTYIEKNGNRLRALDIFRSAFFTDQFLTQEDKQRIVDTINQRAEGKNAENSASAATLEVYPTLKK